MRRQQQQQQEQDQQSRVIYELCSLLLSILRLSSPPHPRQPSSHPISCHQSRKANNEFSLAAFASLLLGISLALMLCGSVTFVIGFMLMPWVLGLVMVFYFVGLVANLSVLGRSILLWTAAGPAAGTASPTATKEMTECTSRNQSIIYGNVWTKLYLQPTDSKAHLYPKYPFSRWELAKDTRRLQSNAFFSRAKVNVDAVHLPYLTRLNPSGFLCSFLPFLCGTD